MASFKVPDVPAASQIIPRVRIIDVEAEQYTTLEEEEIPQSEITHHPNFCDPSLLSNSKFRIMGVLCLLFCAAELGITVIINQYTPDAGAFWSVIAGIIAGLSALFAGSRRVVLAVTIISFTGVPIAAFGCYYESQVWRMATSVTACGKHLGASGNFETEYYGNEYYRSKVDVCVERTRQSKVFDFNYMTYSTCMCSDAAGNCRNLVLQYSVSGCQIIMTRLPTLLMLSIVFAAIATFFIAALLTSGILTLYFECLARRMDGYFPDPPQLEAISVNHLPSDSATAIATAVASPVASPVSSPVPIPSSNEPHYLNEDCIIILKP